MRSFVGGVVKTVIVGFAFITFNYEVVIELLKGRFGKFVVIERVYVNELLNVVFVFNGRDIVGFRRFYD